MIDAFLGMNIIRGPFLAIVFVLAGAALAFLLIRPPTRRWALSALAGVGGGAVVGAVVMLVVRATQAFGPSLPHAVYAWVVVVFAAIGLAVVSLVRTRWWRVVIAAGAVPVFVLAGALGINAHYGLNTTVAAAIGATTLGPADLPGDGGGAAASPVPLFAHWQPPADMPAAGRIGTVVIPPTRSGFRSRPAGLYLPPAALVKNPPRLPFVLLMMGQPGNPDPRYVQPILDAMAARHHGLAPIVLVADQLGDPAVDPLCLNTEKYGNAETFLMQDVVDWARAHLHILRSRDAWTVAGYSNGGECAAYFAAKYPTMWGNFGDISGNAFPGDENEVFTLNEIFHGDQAAWDAVKPATIFAANKGKYADTRGVFTVGANDGYYVQAATENSTAAIAAGVDTTFYVVPGGDHGKTSVDGGFEKLFSELYPRLGLG